MGSLDNGHRASVENHNDPQLIDTPTRRAEFVPFLDYDLKIRRVICPSNAIESLNARYRRAVKARSHFPSEQAVMKCLYLVTRSLDPQGTGQRRWATRWEPALNAITFADRLPAAETNQR